MRQRISLRYILDEAIRMNVGVAWWCLNSVGILVGAGLIRFWWSIFFTKNKDLKRWNGWVIAAMLLFTIMLAQVWPISNVIEWARERVPLVGEVLRTPFTKVSIFLQLGYAYLIGVFLVWVIEKLRFSILRIIMVIGVLGIVSYPFVSWMTKGNLMGEAVMTKIPNEYTDMFREMGSLGEGRVAAMPIPNMWGWEYRDWGEGSGYEGANFTQFGIPQALLIRDFDRWSPYNEGFYGEFSNAIYSCPARSDLVGVNPTRSDLGDREQVTVIYPFAGLMREDIKNVEYGEGVTTLRSDLVGVNPTRSDLVIPGWNVGDIVRIEYKDGESLPAYYVNGQAGPKFLGKEKPEEGMNIIYARVSGGEEWKEYLTEQKFDLPAQAGLQGLTLKVEVPSVPQIYDFGKEGAGTLGNCDVLKRGTAKKSQPVRSDLVGVNPTRSDLESRGTIYVANDRGAACDYIVMKELDPRMSYLMRVKGENKEGRSLKFFLYNTGSKRNDVEWLMSGHKFDQSFALLPWAWDGYYTLNIETRSFGQRAENTMQPVETRWFPLEQIAGARIGGEGTRARHASPLRIAGVKKMGTWLYIVKTENGGLLKLSQGYDEGWLSIGLEHIKVDGWANGWMVPGGKSELAIFYWPQLLEYLGFGIMGVTAVWIAKKRELP